VSGADDNQFIEEHRGLVISIATRIHREMELSLPMEDLEAWGFQGLLEARGRYDNTRGASLATFAYYRIRGAMIDGVRKMGYVSRRAHELAKIAEATDAAAEEVAEKRGALSGPGLADKEVALNDIQGILARTTAAFVIEAVGQSETRAPEMPDELVIASENAARVRAALATLPEKEQKVIRDFYFRGRVLDEIAADFGVSRSWVSRMHTRGLGLLKDALDRSDLGP
jgi:RNA polymerase sigma factor for flagellar operon FliA